MAVNQIENQLGYVDRRFTQDSAINPYSATIAANTRDVAALRARLATISGTTFTTAVLDKMTRNDMIYALRLNDDAAGF